MKKSDRDRLVTRLANSVKKKPFVRPTLSKIEVAEILQTVFRLEAKESIEKSIK